MTLHKGSNSQLNLGGRYLCSQKSRILLKSLLQLTTLACGMDSPMSQRRCPWRVSINFDSNPLYFSSSLRVGKPLQMDINVQIQQIRDYEGLGQCGWVGWIIGIIGMINVDFSGLAQYRSDGRKRNELRATSVELGIDAHADGSCLLKQGLTEVLCLVNGPYQRPNNTDFLLRIEYTVAPFSSLERRKSKHDRQFSEFTQNVRKSFEGVIVQELYKKHQIQILVSVIQNEGSAKSAVLNCISLALVDAGICMRDLVVSCTVGSLLGRTVIDTNEEEEFQLSNEFVVSYLQGSGTLDCVSLRKAKIKEEGVRVIQQQAISSCQQLYQRFRKALLDYSIKKMLIF